MASPETRMMLSTPIDALSNFTGEASVVEFDKAEVDDANWVKKVNVPFRSTESGAIYCYAGTRYGGFEQGYYLARVSGDGATLELEKVGGDCTEVPPESRTFDTGSEGYFVLVR